MRSQLHHHLHETGNVYFDLQSRGAKYGKLVGVVPDPMGEPGGSTLLSGFWGHSSVGAGHLLSDVVTLPGVDHSRFSV